MHRPDQPTIPTTNQSSNQPTALARYKKSSKKNEFIASDAFASNMNCYIFYVDPWRVLCDVVGRQRRMNDECLGA